MALAQDPLTRIVDVNFPGLAVEFTGPSSYLTLSAFETFTKAVISFWFRVPAESIEQAQDEGPAPDWNFDLFRMIPLLMFGQPQSRKRMLPVQTNVANLIGFEGPGPFPVLMSTTSYYQEAIDRMAPCSVVLDCSTTPPCLSFIIQMGTFAFASDENWSVTGEDVYGPAGSPPVHGTAPGSGWSTFGERHTTSIADFTADTRNAGPEVFRVDTRIEIEPDQWHHLLLSFDLSRSCITHGPPQPGDGRNVFYDMTKEGTDSWCRLWYAIDDENYDGLDYMRPFFVDGGTDPNAILTENAWQIANSATGVTGNLFVGPAVCRYSPTPIPLGSVGIPAMSSHDEHMYTVQMAELQFFTGITLDTDDLASRRAFVDDDGKPVNPESAEELLGKKPELLLHRTNNWIKGKNTGAFADQFSPTGIIVKYKPDPSLQGPEDPEARQITPVQLSRRHRAV